MSEAVLSLKSEDLTGQKFHKLTVLKFAGRCGVTPRSTTGRGAQSWEQWQKRYDKFSILQTRVLA